VAVVEKPAVGAGAVFVTLIDAFASAVPVTSSATLLLSVYEAVGARAPRCPCQVTVRTDETFPARSVEMTERLNVPSPSPETLTPLKLTVPGLPSRTCGRHGATDCCGQLDDVCGQRACRKRDGDVDARGVPGVDIGGAGAPPFVSVIEVA